MKDEFHSREQWLSFYRSNMHRFCADCLNIKLNLFQKIIVYITAAWTLPAIRQWIDKKGIKKND